MGYSCTTIASMTLDALVEIIRDTDASNVYRGRFFERGRENSDGAITGTIWKYVDADHVRREGGYKITAEGKILRFPGTTKDERKLAEQTGKARFAKIYPTFEVR
jgi:hypothetical protein